MSSAGVVRLLVVLSEERPVRPTVSYAFDEARENLAAAGESVVLEFLVAPNIEGVVRDAVATHPMAGEFGGRLAVRVTPTEFESDERFDALPDSGSEHDAVRVLVGPGSADVVGGLLDVASERGWTVERVELDRPGRRRLVRGEPARQGLATFVLSFGFYLVLGRLTAFDVLTGAVSALLVAVVLSEVVFVEGVSARRTGLRLLRSVLYLPYLLWAVVRANVHVAAVVLHPRLPIDPSIERVETGTRTDLERAVLANSITLTPGTVAVSVRDEEFHVHALTGASRESLRRGRLERAVRFVFHGRPGSRARGGDAGRPESADREGTG